MAEKLLVQLEDSVGNIYYLHTSADVVFCEDGISVQTKLAQKIEKADIIQNATTASTTKVVSASVAKNLQDQINEQNTNIYCEWKHITNKSSSTSTAETLSLTASKNCWCVVRGFRYWDVTYININGRDVISYQTDGDSAGKVSFVSMFPVKKGITVSIKKPANPQQREYSILFCE